MQKSVKFVLVLLLAVFGSCNATISNVNPQDPLKRVTRRSYVCPPNFIRLSHRCYFFSENKATWQDAYFQCRDLHSNLAIIKTPNQDKLIRRTLNKKRDQPLEWWLGGRYDWEQMAWKWAASGKILSYQGFGQMDTHNKEDLKWHCIIVDPRQQYKWNTKSCLEMKNFICHTKIKIVTNKGKKKLLKQYNVNKYNKLNEIPVPYLPEDANYTTSRLKQDHPGVNLSNNAEFAMKSKPTRKRKAKRNKSNKKKRLPASTNEIHSNNILNDDNHINDLNARGRRQRGKDRAGFERYKWKTYYKNSTNDPMLPKTIVEEFFYPKDA